LTTHVQIELDASMRLTYRCRWGHDGVIQAQSRAISCNTTMLKLKNFLALFR